ncbi:MAG: primosomal protein N' [Rhodothermales bacterium]|nr:primosomal protein N' [Rhodothermales bacterium]
MIASVAVPVPIERSFDYRVPEEHLDSVGIGVHVVVPFGRRELHGIVVNVSHEESASISLKSIVRVVNPESAIPAELVDLARWMADYYLCGLGEVLKLMLPPGQARKKSVAAREEIFISLSPDYRARPAFEEIVNALRGPKQKAILQEVFNAGDSPVHQASLLKKTATSSSTVRSLVARDILVTESLPVDRSDTLLANDSHEPVQFHQAQVEALELITEAVDSNAFHSIVLHGITGSGKTEVYIAALKKVLAAGKTGIILVPEISLTPQTVKRFSERFGNQVAVLHSRMSIGKRFDEWNRIRTGDCKVVVGPRSAILAPIDNIGLIVVDEEHDSSYKQTEPAPRYHARDTAVFRAMRNNAVCILGSATPSSETIANIRSGKYSVVRMPERVPRSDGSSGRLPDVEIVDITLDRKKRRGSLSDRLIEEMSARIARREQVILLQNRRGFAPVVVCRSCGWSPSCPDCSVNVNYHRSIGRMRCHYCGYTEPATRSCPDCASEDLDYVGAGTQRVEDELAELFPDARLLRMDLDTTRTQNGHAKILNKFGRGDADILLGTQMVSKGLDFPNVTLVGVIDADLGLLMPDFRAEERSLQLLMQVSGRAGRADKPGLVLIQSRNVEHPVFGFVLNHDYGGFADYNLEIREQLAYPPFGRMIRVGFRGKDDVRVARLASEWSDSLRSVVTDARILGPVPAFIARTRGAYRYQTVMKMPLDVNFASVRQGIRRVKSDLSAPPNGYHVTIDVDPVGLF